MLISADWSGVRPSKDQVFNHLRNLRKGYNWTISYDMWMAALTVNSMRYFMTAEDRKGCNARGQAPEILPVPVTRTPMLKKISVSTCRLDLWVTVREALFEVWTSSSNGWLVQLSMSGILGVPSDPNLPIDVRMVGIGGSSVGKHLWLWNVRILNCCHRCFFAYSSRITMDLLVPDRHGTASAWSLKIFAHYGLQVAPGY